MYNISDNETFGGIKILQTWSALYVFEKIFNEYKPDLIIELGTFTGASAHFFSLFASVITYDIKDKKNKKTFPNIIYRIKNLFREETIKEIDNIIKTYNKIFIFLDNGLPRKKLWEIYAPLIKKEDLIFVHGWGLSIKPEDVESLIIKLNLKVYKKELCDNWKSLLQGWQKE